MPSKVAFHKSYLSYPTCIKPNHYEEKENEWRGKEGMAGRILKEENMKVVKEFHYASDVTRLNYEELCIHPNLDLPKGF